MVDDTKSFCVRGDMKYFKSINKTGDTNHFWKEYILNDPSAKCFMSPGLTGDTNFFRGEWKTNNCPEKKFMSPVLFMP